MTENANTWKQFGFNFLLILINCSNVINTKSYMISVSFFWFVVVLLARLLFNKNRVWMIFIWKIIRYKYIGTATHPIHSMNTHQILLLFIISCVFCLFLFLWLKMVFRSIFERQSNGSSSNDNRNVHTKTQIYE